MPMGLYSLALEAGATPLGHVTFNVEPHETSLTKAVTPGWRTCVAPEVRENGELLEPAAQDELANNRILRRCDTYDG